MAQTTNADDGSTANANTDERAIAYNRRINHEHSIFELFKQLGWSTEQLVDPADMCVGTVESDEQLTLVKWRSAKGPVEFSIDESNLTEDARYSEATAGIEYGRLSTVQPIGFSDPLNRDSNLPDDLAQFYSKANEHISLFAVGERGTVPAFTQADVVAFFSRLSAHANLRREVVERLSEAFDTTLSLPYDKDGHGEYIQAYWVLPKLAGEIGTSKSPDSDIQGHKKRNRQRFSRNLNVLQSAVAEAQPVIESV